ncbi:MAG: CaiB/BaiF CoA transferase family protein [Acidimicrobiales bacterium]
MFAPLDGVRVIDLTHVLAGPTCTHLLALLGADVVKVEPPEGDSTRGGGPVGELNDAGLGLAFCTQNSDKSSIVVDLSAPAGPGIVRALVAGADVVVENFRPGVADRLGLGVDALTAITPSLVYVSLSAYGQDGPLGHRPAYDHVVQAMSGIMEVTGTEATGPVKVGAPYVDYAAGQRAAFATLAAVLEQRRTGRAQRVDVAMLDAALLLMASALTATAVTGRRPAKLGNEAASGAAASGCFNTADGLLAVAANTDRQFRALCAALGRAELADDERFAAAADRQANASAFRTVVSDVLATSPADRWEAVLDTAGVPAARVRSLDVLLEEGQPAARGVLAPVEVDGRTLALPTVGFKVGGEAPGPRRPPPALGADTDRVLADLGYDGVAIAALRADGVVG